MYANLIIIKKEEVWGGRKNSRETNQTSKNRISDKFRIIQIYIS